MAKFKSGKDTSDIPCLIIDTFPDEVVGLNRSNIVLYNFWVGIYSIYSVAIATHLQILKKIYMLLLLGMYLLPDG